MKRTLYSYHELGGTKEIYFFSKLARAQYGWAYAKRYYGIYASRHSDKSWQWAQAERMEKIRPIICAVVRRKLDEAKPAHKHKRALQQAKRRSR